MSAREPRPVTIDAHELVNGDRNADYGHPLDDFTRVGDLWAVEFGHAVTAEQVARCLVMLKLAREMHVPKRDNRVDGAGYFETLDMVVNERKRREHADKADKHRLTPEMREAFERAYEHARDLYGPDHP